MSAGGINIAQRTIRQHINTSPIPHAIIVNDYVIFDVNLFHEYCAVSTKHLRTHLSHDTTTILANAKIA